jgi:hypothetical protein
MGASDRIGFFEFAVVENRLDTQLMLAGRFCFGGFASCLIGEKKVRTVYFSKGDMAGGEFSVRESRLVLFERVFLFVKGAAHGGYYSNLTLYNPGN